jgi:PQQ-like domain
VTVAQDFDGDSRELWGEEEIDVSGTDGYLPVYDGTLFAVGVILRQHKPGEAGAEEEAEEAVAEEDAEEDAEDDDAEPPDRLLALDPRTSELGWSRDGLSDDNGYGSTRTLAAAGLVFVHMGEYGMVVAVDVQTQAVRWRWRSTPALGGSAPLLLQVGDTRSRIRGSELFVADGLVYVIEHVDTDTKGPHGLEEEGSARLFARDAHSGQLRWSVSLPTEGHGGRELRSTMANGVLYLVDWRTLYALR